MCFSHIDGCTSISLQEILKAREVRAQRQKELCQNYMLPLLSVTLNIVGCYKQFPLAQKTFDLALRLVFEHMQQDNISIEHMQTYAAYTGSEAFFVLHGDVYHIKSLLVRIEENLAIARLFDLDLLDAKGNKIGRTELGLPPRSCLLCQNPAHICARSRAHSIEDVFAHSLRLMEEHFQKHC